MHIDLFFAVREGGKKKKKGFKDVYNSKYTRKKKKSAVPRMKFMLLSMRKVD